MAGLTNGAGQQVPAFLDKVVDFPETGKSYELLKPLTDYRTCHDGTPTEARILFTCREASKDPEKQGDGALFVMKVKVQVPMPGQEPAPGPSTTTKDELEALKVFQKANSQDAPQLVTWKLAVQGDSGPLPGGFLSYILMTALPGETLFTLNFWQLPTEERQVISEEFLKVLRKIHTIGIEPIDRGLRNILWDKQTQKCSVIDFELWRNVEQVLPDETKELQRWGLARAPPHTDFYTAFNTMSRD